MNKTVYILFIIIIAGCKLRSDNSIVNTAAIHFAGVFITENVPSTLHYRIKGRPNLEKDDNSDIYHVSGMVEGDSSYNVPFRIDHFNETLRYLGGYPNERSNWQCLEIYIGNKKIK